MFAVGEAENEQQKIMQSANLLKSDLAFEKTMQDVLIKWPIASAVNLTNKGQNRKAWLGAAACMYKHKAPEYVTRLAWATLTQSEQQRANMVAQKIIDQYENKKSHAKTLFD
jgi:hypothetical protein